jgi:hypothetical protein
MSYVTLSVFVEFTVYEFALIGPIEGEKFNEMMSIFQGSLSLSARRIRNLGSTMIRPCLPTYFMRANH